MRVAQGLNVPQIILTSPDELRRIADALEKTAEVRLSESQPALLMVHQHAMDLTKPLDSSLLVMMEPDSTEK